MPSAPNNPFMKEPDELRQARIKLGRAEQRVRCLRSLDHAAIRGKLVEALNAALQNIPEFLLKAGNVLVLELIGVRIENGWPTTDILMVRRDWPGQLQGFPEVREILEYFDLQYQEELFDDLGQQIITAERVSRGLNPKPWRRHITDPPPAPTEPPTGKLIPLTSRR